MFLLRVLNIKKANALMKVTRSQSIGTTVGVFIRYVKINLSRCIEMSEMSLRTAITM